MSRILEIKTLISVLAISMLMTDLRKEALKCISYIYYQVQFKKNTIEIWALMNLGIEINAIAPVYIKKLGLWVQKTDVRVQKIDRSTLETYDMVIAGFQV